MQNPQILQILIRIGLALAAGLLMAMVPISYTKARFNPKPVSRIVWAVLCVAFLFGFVGYMWFLWTNFVPR